MIDEKKLIEELKHNDLEFMQQADLMDCLGDIVNRQPKIDKWIPCSERLPDREEYIKNDGRFIVTDGNRRYQSIFDIYSKKFKTMNQISPVGWFSLVEDKSVIAWQPLPEPYKSSDSQK